MPTKMYLKLDNIKGDCTDTYHKDEIVVIAWSWGVDTTNEVTGVAAHPELGRPNIQQLILSKWVDIASPPLMLTCCSGQHILKAVLEITVEELNRKEIIKITLDDVVVHSAIVDKSEGEPRFRENIALKGAKVRFEYKLTSGDRINLSSTFGWDIVANRAIR